MSAFPTEKRTKGHVPTENGYWYLRRVYGSSVPGDIFPVHVQFFKNKKVRVNHRIDQDLTGSWGWVHDINLGRTKKYYADFEWFGPVTIIEEK